MDVTIYLPDELGRRAKARPDVNLSRMLRDSLMQRFAEEDAMEKTIADAREVVLDLEDDDGRRYRGRITATRLTESEDPEVYLVDDGKVLVYEPEKLRYSVVDDPERDLIDLRSEDYVEIMAALGLVPTIDLVLG